MKIIDFLRKLFEVLWSIPTRLFGSRNERLLKHYSGAVAQINALEPEIAKLSDAALAAKTGELRKRYSEGATLEQLLPEAFAVVRESAKTCRTWRRRTRGKPTRRTSPTGPTTSSASTICATTWRCTSTSASSADCITPS